MNGAPGKKTMLSGRLRSFVCAFNGLKFILRSQLNFMIHLSVGFIVILCGFLARLNATEWCILMVVMGLVISMEAMNTAIEQLVDFVSPDYHKQAGIVKDIAAGAVLLAAVTAVVTGIILFLPKMI